MEFCNCDLAKVCKQKGSLPEPQAYIILIKILKALRKLKSHRVIHRDLKPGNIALSFKNLSSEIRLSTDGRFEAFLKNFDFVACEDDFEVKLLDLGMSETLDEEGFGSNLRSGTP